MRKALAGLCLVAIVLSFGVHQSLAGSAASQDYARANKMFTAGKYAEAVNVYRGILLSPANDVSLADVYTRLGDCYFKLQDYPNAREAYRGALAKQQKSTERAQTQYWIGFCSFLSGKDSEAVNEFLKIPELYPDSGMWVSTAYYWAGRASERMGRKDKAAEFYRKAGGKGKSSQERYAIKKAEGAKKSSIK